MAGEADTVTWVCVMWAHADKKVNANAKTMITFATAQKDAVSVNTSAESDGVELVELPKNYTSQRVDEILADPSDEQVRRLLIVELQRAAADSRDASRDVADRGILCWFS